MTQALAFDIYGTLIDPHGVVRQLEDLIGSRAAEFSRVWREKQLEYTWRRGLMRRYENFGVCTRQALDYADSLLETGFDDETKTGLMQAYRVLPAYEDVADSLQLLREHDRQLYAFSNGTREMVTAVLENARIDQLFDGVISVDELQTFKPDPAVYAHVIQRSGIEPGNCWLVSSNAFDVIGAVAAGMRAAWLQRSSAVVFDPWGVNPDLVIQSLDELPQKLD